MASLVDYLRWRGDLSFVERPFNDADNIILSAFAYVGLWDIVPTEEQGGSMTLGDACKALLTIPSEDLKARVCFLGKIDAEFILLLSKSPRFCNIVLSAYVDEVDVQRNLQFAAFTAKLDDGSIYVAYRGTDSAIVGWREDFMLSFTITESQHEAARYLQRAMQRTAEADGGPVVRVGGHSKGGNLAEYAGLRCPADLRERLVCVYSNDGPGIAPEVMPEAPGGELGSTLRCIVPSCSVVGMLFAQPDDKRSIVASSVTGIMQHDLTTWLMQPTGIDEVKGLLHDSSVLNNAIATWMERLSLEERARITDQIFSALQAGGAKELPQIIATPKDLSVVIRALNETDELTHEVVKSLLECLKDSKSTATRKAARKMHRHLWPQQDEEDESAIAQM
ncbi:MAG: DUF2974 domain-containing protein [Coriobacteriales bacterium]|nr:DUF2974 domain-containing protein [Coriobacteriales bacterium]